MHCEREELWFRDNLKLTTPITTFPTVAGLARAEWRVQVNKVIIVQGSASFCRKMVEGLSKLGINEETKIIVTSNEKCRKLKLCFRFLRLSHSKLGGATDTITSIGYTKACCVSKDPTFMQGIPSTVMDHICPMKTGHDFDPLLSNNATGDGTTQFLDVSVIHPIRAIAVGSFLTLSVFSQTNWVTRNLSNAEILSVMDSPVQITKQVNKEDLDIHLSEKVETLEHMIPIKVLQEATRLLFDWEVPVERPHITPVYDVNHLGLTLEGLENIYDEIDQAQVAKNDNAIPDTTLWDEAVLKPVGALAKEIEFIIGGRNHSQEVKALELIRTRQSYQYKKNVRPSFANYMKFTYSPLVFDKS